MRRRCDLHSSAPEMVIFRHAPMSRSESAFVGLTCRPVREVPRMVHEVRGGSPCPQDLNRREAGKLDRWRMTLTAALTDSRSTRSTGRLRRHSSSSFKSANVARSLRAAGLKVTRKSMSLRSGSKSPPRAGRTENLQPARPRTGGRSRRVARGTVRHFASPSFCDCYAGLQSGARQPSHGASDIFLRINRNFAMLPSCDTQRSCHDVGFYPTASGLCGKEADVNYFFARASAVTH